MVNENTPLIQVVQVRPVVRPRYPHNRLRRFCTILLAAVSLFSVVVLVILLLVPNLLEPGRPGIRPPRGWHPTSIKINDEIGPHNFSSLAELLYSIPDNKRMEESSRYYTAGPHLAGKNLSQALWTRERWQEAGIPSVEIISYDTYINYPVDHSLTLLEKESKKGAATDNKNATWKVSFEASLKEDVLEEDPTSGLDDRIPTFHGYSASGNVTAPFVYVNYGSYWDFEDLVKANVSLEGKIAIARYGGIFRGLKVKRAQDLGMVGVVMYSDPGDDGEVTEENGYKPYPEGPAREPNSVQRGSVQFLGQAAGDPTTPGYPSKPGVPRQDTSAAIPQIPSIPISYNDALPILKALNGHGPKPTFNKYWEQNQGLRHKGIKYNVGPSPDEVVLNLYNEQEYTITPLWNVIGIINGTVPDEVIILGNHRDAWIAGGAADPNSGSAALNEVVRAFGAALETGWKPFRTVVFASWDGEEYGLIGSTEWVEEYLPWLSASTIAYLNVDVGSSGPSFSAAAAPLLHRVLVETVSEIPSPNQTVANQTVYDLWDHNIRTMGSGSDFTAFQDFAGIPSLDIGFKPGGKSPIYHYHSNYDSFAWMSKFGDVDFLYHQTIARVWAVLAAKLIESPVVRLNATDYAIELGKYVDSVRAKAKESNNFKNSTSLFSPMDTALAELFNVSVALDAESEAVTKGLEQLGDDIPWWKWWYRIRLIYRARALNSHYKALERQFLFEPGLDDRSWFKHVVFAPGKWTGYAGATFPGIVESIESGNLTNAKRWIGIATDSIKNATSVVKIN